MTVLELIQKFCQRQGLPPPSTITAAADDQIIQLRALLEELLDDMVVRHNWQGVTYEVVFNSVATESQGTIASICPRSYYKILNETIFDRTRRLPIFGPKSPQDWSAMKAIPLTGPYYQYRIRGNELLIFPQIEAGHVLALEYISRALLLNPAETGDAQYVTTVTNDACTFLVPESLVLAGLRYKWKQEKGFVYDQDYQDFERRLAEESGADGTKPRLSLDGGQVYPQPGIFVPSGNWDLA